MMKRMICAAILGLAGAANATTVIYDEATDGDFSDRHRQYTALGVIPDGYGEILGSISATGSGGDEHDTFSFTLLEDTQVDMSFSNANSEFLGDVIFFGYRNGRYVGLGSSSLPNVLHAGDYGFTLTPIANRGDFDWRMSFGIRPLAALAPAPVPLPAGAALYLPVLAGAGYLAARKRRKSS